MFFQKFGRIREIHWKLPDTLAQREPIKEFSRLLVTPGRLTKLNATFGQVNDQPNIQEASLATVFNAFSTQREFQKRFVEWIDKRLIERLVKRLVKKQVLGPL